MLSAIAGLVSFIPGVGPLVGAAVTAVGYLLRCKPCLYALGIAALCGWVAIHVHRADVAHCDARIEDDHKAAAEAAVRRDAGVRADLETKYKPQISTLEQRSNKLQEEVASYEKRKPVAGVAKCPLGSDPLRLRNLPR